MSLLLPLISVTVKGSLSGSVSPTRTFSFSSLTSASVMALSSSATGGVLVGGASN